MRTPIKPKKRVPTTVQMPTKAATVKAAPLATPKPAQPRGFAAADPMAQINRVIATDSPLMDRARYEGTVQAHRRGMGSSSMAAGAAMDAGMDRAIEIGGLAAQQGHETIEARKDRQMERGESRRERKFKAGENQADRRLERQEGRKTRRMNVSIADKNASALAQDRLAQSVQNITTTHEQAIASIDANENLSKEARANRYRAVNDRFNRSMSLVRDIYDVPLQWDTDIPIQGRPRTPTVPAT